MLLILLRRPIALVVRSKAVAAEPIKCALDS